MSNLHPKMFVSAVRDLPVTVFVPRESEPHLGMFESPSGVLYARLTGSHTIGKEPNSDVFHSQYGSVIIFNDLAREFARLLNAEPNPRINIRVSARQEVRMNVTQDEIYINGTWVVYGFEYNNTYYTTRGGELVKLAPDARNSYTDKQSEASMYNSMLRDRNVTESTNSGNVASGSRRVRL